MSRGDTIYAWQEWEPNGDWGIIAAVIPALGTTPVPLVMRDPTSALRAEPLARAHAAASGNPVRLARFELAEAEGLVERGGATEGTPFGA